MLPYQPLNTLIGDNIMSHQFKTLILGSLLTVVVLSPVHACVTYGSQMTGRIKTLQTGPIYHGHVVFNFVI